jgi:hypothetical protein
LLSLNGGYFVTNTSNCVFVSATHLFMPYVNILVSLMSLLINNFVKRYSNLTPMGLEFQLSLSDTGICCIMVRDIFDCTLEIRYFTKVNLALRYINNL